MSSKSRHARLYIKKPPSSGGFFNGALGRLEEGFVITDEPGIYFIPALIDDWRSKGHCKEFINYDLLETYKDFGGIRIEDDLLITKDGCRFLGEKRIPYHTKDVEEYMERNKE